MSKKAKIYQIGVQIMIEADMFIEAENVKEAVEKTEEGLETGKIGIDDLDINGLEIVGLRPEGQVDSPWLFKEAIKNHVKSLAQVHNLEPDMIETILEDFVTKAGRVLRKVSPSGMILKTDEDEEYIG